MHRSIATAALVAAASLVTSVAISAATEKSAEADGLYVGEAFGGAKVSGALADRMSSVFRGRLTLGYRFGAWAVEGFAGIDVGGPDYHDSQYGAVERTTSGSECDCTGGGYNDEVIGAMGEVGVNVKHFTRISEHTELYLRGGLSKAWLDNDYAGRGIGIGAGIQVKGKVPAIGLLFWPLFFTDWGPKITMAGFVDTGADFYRLHEGGNLSGDSIDGTMHSLTAGIAFGSDF
jgi:opacity protein-like surface antigen